MPLIREMFESRFLSFHDMPKNEMVYVTIRGVVPHELKARAGAGGLPQPVEGVPAQQPRAELSWLLWFHEFRKPMVLRKNRAAKIAAVLASDNTDDWVGKRIGIYRGVWSNGGEAGEGIMIDDRPVPPIPTTHQMTGAQGVRRMAPIPHSAVQRFVGMIGQHGKTWDDFLRWLKGVDLTAAGACFGQELSAIPGFCLPFMKAYLDHLHAPDDGAPDGPPEALPQPTEGGVDFRTGEVIEPQREPVERRVGTTGPGSMFTFDPKTGTTVVTRPEPEYEPITDEDIPF